MEDAFDPNNQEWRKAIRPAHHRKIQTSPNYTGFLNLKQNNHTDKGLHCNFLQGWLDFQN